MKTLIFVMILLMIASYNVGYNMHPMEQCARQYGMNPDYLGECTWLLMNKE